MASDSKAVKIFLDAVTLTGIVAGMGWVVKKVLKENFLSDPLSSGSNFFEFSAIMAGSIALKNYLMEDKIIPNNI